MLFAARVSVSLPSCKADAVNPAPFRSVRRVAGILRVGQNGLFVFVRTFDGKFHFHVNGFFRTVEQDHGNALAVRHCRRVEGVVREIAFEFKRLVKKLLG